MIQTAATQLTYSGGFSALEDALHVREDAFGRLLAQMRSFTPKAETEFQGYREQWIAYMREINPGMAERDLAEFAAVQVAHAADPGEQLARAFGAQFNAEVMAITVLSHALIEGVINALLALGLAKNGSPDLFPLIERADVRHKWIHGPKAFNAGYRFPVGGAAHEALAFLCRQRNALVHYKISLKVNDEQVLDGSKLTRLSFADEAKWGRRFLDLPYDLLAIANQQLGLALGGALLTKRLTRGARPASFPILP